MSDAANQTVGQAMHAFCASLFPICRSITGKGARQTLAAVAEKLPLTLTEVPSGTPAFDWVIPREWNIRDAWVKNSQGEKVIDFARSNLHVVNYSVPVRGRATLDELRARLHTLPDHPDWVPYRTSYYKDDWGFCLTQQQLDALPPGEYEYCIDSSLEPGSMTLGEVELPGESPDTVLISTHICHPSLANDNLSGLAVATWLAQHVAALPKRRYTYRFVFIPGTIGAVAWLSQREDLVPRIKHGLVLSGVGDTGPIHYKRSRRESAEIDQVMEFVLKASAPGHTIMPFIPYGYDERQYCSPGFNLPVGCMMRTPFGKNPQYHTSADNLELLSGAALQDSLERCQEMVAILEGNQRYLNLNPKCEPLLGKRGLYSTLGGENDAKAFQMALLWVLSYSDGEHSLLDIARKAEMPFRTIRAAADALEKAELLSALP